MSNNVLLITAIEMIIIAAVSVAGVYGLAGSEVYAAVRDFTFSRNPALTLIIPLVVGGFLFIFGVFTVGVRGNTAGGFTWLAILCCIPSLLSYNSLHLLNIFGIDFQMKTDLPEYQVLGIGLFLMLSYVTLNCMAVLKQARYSLTDRGALAGDIETVNSRSHILLLGIVVGSLALAILIAVFSAGLAALISGPVRIIPWNAVLSGVSLIILLIAYLYWLGTRDREKVKVSFQI